MFIFLITRVDYEKHALRVSIVSVAVAKYKLACTWLITRVNIKQEKTLALYYSKYTIFTQNFHLNRCDNYIFSRNARFPLYNIFYLCTLCIRQLSCTYTYIHRTITNAYYSIIKSFCLKQDLC